jgi:hypothetical protein
MTTCTPSPLWASVRTPAIRRGTYDTYPQRCSGLSHKPIYSADPTWIGWDMAEQDSDDSIASPYADALTHTALSAAMDENEFASSPVVDAINEYLDSAGSMLEFIAEMAFGGGLAATDDGKGKFERQLRMVGLDGAVPADLAKAMVWANAVRNILVHSASRVDKRFLERCPDSGFSLGEKIALDHLDCAKIILGLQTYMYIVMNRFRQKHGLPPIQCNQATVNKFRDSFNAMFPDAISVEQLSG